MRDITPFSFLQFSDSSDSRSFPSTEAVKMKGLQPREAPLRNASLLSQRILKAVQQQAIEFFGLVRISGCFIYAIQHYKYRFYPIFCFSADGYYGWGIFGYSIGFQKRKHQPFPMAQLYVGVSGDGQ